MQAAEDFLFPPDSQIWRLSCENALLLGGPAAAILQVAHPEIAAGVAQHSNFKADTLGRLHRTLDAVYRITFATRAEAAEVSERVAAVHAKVRGETPVSYNAFSPGAQMWVIATLISQGTWVFEQLIAPLTKEEREAHYHDMRVFGASFGLDPAYGPQTADAFQDYYATMLEGPMLGALPLSREVAQAVARPPAPRWLNIASIPLSGLVTESLPSPVRERLGFRSTPASRAAFALARNLLRTLLPILPERLRYTSHYRKARNRADRKTSRLP
jgi:uncharacterized protein (DUF2236 family)